MCTLIDAKANDERKIKTHNNSAIPAYGRQNVIPHKGWRKLKLTKQRQKKTYISIHEHYTLQIGAPWRRDFVNVNSRMWRKPFLESHLRKMAGTKIPSIRAVSRTDHDGCIMMSIKWTKLRTSMQKTPMRLRTLSSKPLKVWNRERHAAWLLFKAYHKS